MTRGLSQTHSRCYALAVPIRRPGSGRWRSLSLGTCLVGLLTKTYATSLALEGSTNTTEKGCRHERDGTDFISR